jgi:hypothetical protein
MNLRDKTNDLNRLCFRVAMEQLLEGGEYDECRIAFGRAVRQNGAKSMFAET